MTHAISKANAEHYVWGHQCDGWHLLKLPQLSIIQERVPVGAGEVRHYDQRAQQSEFLVVSAPQAHGIEC